MTLSATSAPIPCDLFIRAGVAVTQDDERRLIHDVGLAISDGVIEAIGPHDDIAGRYSPAERIDLSDKMVMPGLVNGHIHLPMTLFRGYADDLPLMQWLEEHIWPVEFQLTDDMLEIGALIGCAELIRTGTTAMLNGYFHEWVTGKTVSGCGLRAILGEGFFGFPSPHFPTAQDCWNTISDLERRFSDDPLIRTAVTPHAAFTVSPEEISESYKLACALDIPWQIHIAETPVETAMCIEKHGKRPIKILEDAGVLSPRTTLHHCVDVNDEEIELLAASEVNIVHNPASNQKLCSGLAPVQKLLDAGVTVGLGTDGASSNNQLNLFRDMGLAAITGKVAHGDASAVSAQSVLDMATRGSARCLGWPELGQLTSGQPADLIALDLNQPNMLPLYNHVSHAVYATTGMEVCFTMVGGRILYRDGEYETIDIQALQSAAAEAVKWVQGKAKK